MVDMPKNCRSNTFWAHRSQESVWYRDLTVNS